MAWFSPAVRAEMSPRPSMMRKVQPMAWAASSTPRDTPSVPPLRMSPAT